MKKYIDADRLRWEIKKQVRFEELSFAALGGGGQNFCTNTLEWVLKQIDTLQQEQPEYGYITTKYIPGQKPRWKVGDILAYYINNSDEEGEDVLGKVVKIRPDEIGGWLYAFENEDVWDEESLIREGAYGK